MMNNNTKDKANEKAENNISMESPLVTANDEDWRVAA